MNCFEAVRGNVTARQVAESCGLKVNRNGMACCPFHNDRNPSLKLTERYFCFGCGAKGDAIDFVANYYRLGLKDAAVKICEDFGLAYDTGQKKTYRSPPGKPIKPQKSDEQILKELSAYCYNVLCDYLHLLEKWKIEYAPKDENSEWHPYFCEALEELDHVKYLIDLLWEGSDSDRAFVVSDYGRKVVEIGKRIKQIKSIGRGNQEVERSKRNNRKKPEPCL